MLPVIIVSSKSGSFLFIDEGIPMTSTEFQSKNLPQITKSLFPHGIDDIPLYILQKWQETGTELAEMWMQKSPNNADDHQYLMDEFIDKFKNNQDFKDVSCPIGKAADNIPYLPMTTQAFLIN